MSRLTDLMRQVHATDPKLGADLVSEIQALTKRRSFGLVFERHQPEAVELPGITPKRGSKVRILEPRGSVARGDNRLWLIERIMREDGSKTAHLVELYAETPERVSVPVDDLVLVAEFKDGLFPGMVETGRVERGGDKPFHTVINAENFHALEMLTYTHRGKVDAIYIDPPYNTGAKDWKYNNDYVEGDDAYRHSKWLAMMERRLLIAKELLNPNDSVLIVTIDEKEVHRLSLLLEQTFPEARIQLVTLVINPLGQERSRELARVEEYALFLFFGQAAPTKSSDDLLNEVIVDEESLKPVRWERLIRGGGAATRGRNPDLFFPIFIDADTKTIIEVGEPLDVNADRKDVKVPVGLTAVWPIRRNGSEGRWRCSPTYLRSLLAQGYVRVGAYDKKHDQWTISYLGKAQIERISSGEIEIVSRAKNGYVILGSIQGKPLKVSPKTVWSRPSHRAGEYGTALNSSLIPGRLFDYPKSLYSVEDALRVAVGNKPSAVILDFFSGSGTTAHAVMRLNKQDGGHRQCIAITNNEVSADEQKKLRKKGLRPGDSEWEALGICDYITKPRVTAAITGKTPDGEPIKGNYKFTDEFPMANGFKENAAFFTLTYESPLSVRHGRAFERVASMLWLRAGSRGRIITTLGERGWDISDVYGVLDDFDHAAEFLAALANAPGVQMVFFVTDDDAVFQMVCRKLPEGVEPVQLYSSYLHNFELNRGRS
ncbi:site-specific DNA-methyltransferase [Dermabacteraceae bacterium P13115]